MFNIFNILGRAVSITPSWPQKIEEGNLEPLILLYPLPKSKIVHLSHQEICVALRTETKVLCMLGKCATTAPGLRDPESCMLSSVHTQGRKPRPSGSPISTSFLQVCLSPQGFCQGYCCLPEAPPAYPGVTLGGGVGQASWAVVIVLARYGPWRLLLSCLGLHRESTCQFVH